MAKSNKTTKLRRAQLDRQLLPYKTLLSTKRPKTGWIKELRLALGMSMADLASRLGVIKQRIEALEKNEVAGSVTIESLRKAAEAMDCEFTYYFVPKKGLQKHLEHQALQVATSIVEETGHNMNLELQETSKSAQKELIQDLAEELLRAEDRRIWSFRK